ncbi:MAG: WbqC family protein [Bacteroidota bacterium]|nr:WbqC family protein [Bacteroidota bacterium]
MEAQTLIAVCPPEYFPRLAYAARMQVADYFVLADTFQYSRQSYQNRTRIRNAQSWQWVSVPLKGGQHGRPQCTTRVRQESGWRTRHWKAFLFNYGATPFFDYFAPQLQVLFESEWHTLSRLTCRTAQLTHRWLEFSGSMLLASELPGQPACVRDVLDCLPTGTQVRAQGVPEPGARLELAYEHPQYRQAFTGFHAHMCALDLLFNYGPDSARILRTGSVLTEIPP